MKLKAKAGSFSLTIMIGFNQYLKLFHEATCWFIYSILNMFLDAKQKKESVLPEPAEYFLLKQQLDILPQVEALDNNVAANELLAINMTKVKHVKNKKKRCQQLETR